MSFRTQRPDVALGYLVKSVLDDVQSDEYATFTRAEAKRRSREV